jgi:NAD(P)-dependent dehydrogenase (short-subunit alcohol dehydrogenase family)
VVLAGRRAELLAATTGEVRRAGGENADVAADVTDPGAVDRLFAETERRWGRIDILLTCAGVFVSGKETQDLTLEEWDCAMSVNFRGTGEGVIINCTSVSGRVAQRKQTPYNVSTAAVEMMAKCMALELGPYNITVNTICPGADGDRDGRGPDRGPRSRRLHSAQRHQAPRPADGHRLRGALPRLRAGLLGFGDLPRRRRRAIRAGNVAQYPLP